MCLDHLLDIDSLENKALSFFAAVNCSLPADDLLAGT